MKKRNLQEKFTTFCQPGTTKNSLVWVPKRSLKNNIKALFDRYPEKDEKFWVGYWLKAASDNSDPLALEHLRAYLEESCYWSAIATYRKFGTPDLTVWDYFQIARITAPARIFNGYNPQKSHPCTYAQMRLKSAIRDVVLKDRRADGYTDWALLQFGVSKKALTAALQQIGVSEPKLSSYLLAWQGFQEICAQTKAKGNQQLPAPTPQQLQAIATYCNELSQLAITASVSEALLQTCIRAARAYNKIQVTPLDADNPALEFTINEKLEEADNPALEFTINEKLEESEIEERSPSEKWQLLREVLTRAIAPLPPKAKKMLILEYGLSGFNQTQIGREVGIQQYQVSRQLRDYRQILLAALVEWSKIQTGSQLNVEQIDALSKDILPWLNWYWQTTICHNCLRRTLRRECFAEIPLLQRYYGQNVPLEAIASEFNCCENQLHDKLTQVKTHLQQRLLQWMQITFNLSDATSHSAAKPLAILVEKWLTNLQYSIF